MLVPGLRNTIALDFHLNQSALYWTDVVEDKIYRGKLSENGGERSANRQVFDEFTEFDGGLRKSDNTLDKIYYRLHKSIIFTMATGSRVLCRKTKVWRLEKSWRRSRGHNNKKKSNILLKNVLACISAQTRSI